MEDFGNKVLISIFITGDSCNIPRYRKCYINGSRIIAVGRCGGSNRDEYQYLVEFEKFICDYNKVMNKDEFDAFSQKIENKDKVWSNLCYYVDEHNYKTTDKL